MDLNECINFLLTVAHNNIFKELSTLLSDYDVTPVQYGVLYCLWRLGKTSPKEIADELHIENSTISGVLLRMEKKGLIERRLSESDRRFIIIELTDKARALEEPILHIVNRFNADILADMHEEEQKVLRADLVKLGEVKISNPSQILSS